MTFGLGGANYEIDLNDKNAAKLQNALEPFIAAARQVTKSSRRSKKAGGNGASAAEIRE